MVAGIAALRMPPNVVVIHPFRAQSFFYQAEYDVRRDIKLSSLHLIERTDSELVQRREHTSGLVTTVLLPITFFMHWGIVIDKYDVSNNTGYVVWGDSLGYNPPAGVLNVMRTFMAKNISVNRMGRMRKLQLHSRFEVWKTAGCIQLLFLRIERDCNLL